jgi:hypothetical protein
VEVQPATPEPEQDDIDNELERIETDALIDALRAAMIWQDEAERETTIQIIKALEVSKSFA